MQRRYVHKPQPSHPCNLILFSCPATKPFIVNGDCASTHCVKGCGKETPFHNANFETANCVPAQHHATAPSVYLLLPSLLAS
jgi:hypothetical protein